LGRCTPSSNLGDPTAYKAIFRGFLTETRFATGAVSVADVVPSEGAEEIGDPLCDYCGLPIEEPDQDCPACDDWRCRP